MAILKALAEANPQSAEVFFNLGNAYAHDNQYEAAAEAYSSALRIDPENDIVRLSLGKALVTLKHPEAAVSHLETYVERKPEDSDGLYVLGRAYRGVERWGDSARVLEKSGCNEAR